MSSSGHLVVVPALFGWRQPSLTFDLVLHLGTLLAAVFALRREVIALALGLVGRGEDPGGMRRLLGLLVLGSIPAGIAGLAFASFFEDRFDDPLTTCAELVVTGLILLAVERLVHGEPGTEPVDAPRSVAIGAAQAIAILPGISRSGTTIAAALGLRISREEATRFSFLLSIPAIAGAALTRVPDVADGRFHVTGSVVAGFVAATVVGWVSIDWLLRYVRTHSLRSFAYYLFVFAPVSAVIIELR